MQTKIISFSCNLIKVMAVFDTNSLKFLQTMKLKITTLALLIAGSLSAQNIISREFNSIKSIDMSTGSGDCVVKRSSGTKVIVEVEHYYGDDYDPQIEQKGDKLKIKESDKGWGSWSASRSPKWTLTVPDKMRLDFMTGSGDFYASGLELILDMNAGSGDIELSDIKGELLSNTGSGDVELHGFNGFLKLNTGSGDVNVRNGKGEIRINCGSGEIDIRGAEGTISANVGSGEVNAEGIMITGSSTFNSGSGDVEVALVASPTANLSVNSGSGDASLDFNGAAMVGGLIMKANKRHGEIEAPFDFDTTEEVEEYSHTVIKKTKKFDDSDVEIQVSTGSGTASVSK